MATTSSQTLSALSSLFQIVEASERGYATAATNVKNRGLKFLFKSFAQQRARFKSEILSEAQRLEGELSTRTSILGVIHRGRVAIYSAMTIDPDQRERVVIKEAALGERYAAQAYQKALAEDLPLETRALIERQYEEVREVIEDIHHLLGKDSKTMLVQLYDSDKEADAAVSSLTRAGFPAEAAEKAATNPEIDLYQGKGTTVRDTILSGMVGGVVWGSLIGVLAGFGAVQTNTAAWMGVNSIIGTWALIALATIVLAAIGGGILGLFIGVGISEDDRYIYRDSAQHGRYLVKVLVDSTRTREAREILKQINQQSKKPAASVSA